MSPPRRLLYYLLVDGKRVLFCRFSCAAGSTRSASATSTACSSGTIGASAAAVSGIIDVIARIDFTNHFTGILYLGIGNSD